MCINQKEKLGSVRFGALCSTIKLRTHLSCRCDHWGQFHELGHNHQDPAWTWSNTTEATVNFFSTRAMYVVRNQTNPANFYGWNCANYTRRELERAAWYARGALYSELCTSPALYLDSFLQVRRNGEMMDP